MKTEFTKGEWSVGKTASQSKTSIWVGGSRIAIIDEFPHEGSQANAKLIAASPNLFKALELATELLKDHATYTYDHEVIAICESALNKAVLTNPLQPHTNY